LVLTLIVTASGCGSGDSDATAGGAAGVSIGDLTKAEFVKEANEICKRGSDQIHDESEPFRERQGLDAGVALTRKQEEEFVAEVVVPSIQAQAEGVAELGAPEGELGEVAAIVERLEKVAKAGERDPGSILQEGNGNPISEVNAVAKAYGVEECTQP
jgi:hypothetical protein